MKRLVFVIAAGCVTALVWFVWPSRNKDGGAATSDGTGLVSNPSARSKISPPPTAEVSHLADALNSPSSDIRADLRIVDECVATYRSNFPHDGNPIGSNAEITAALTGKNKLHLALIPPNHPAINSQRELCDRWGTPFFFHAESASRMEFRSAGPDRKMWTADDVVFTP